MKGKPSLPLWEAGAGVRAGSRLHRHMSVSSRPARASSLPAQGSTWRLGALSLAFPASRTFPLPFLPGAPLLSNPCHPAGGPQCCRVIHRPLRSHTPSCVGPAYSEEASCWVGPSSLPPPALLCLPPFPVASSIRAVPRGNASAENRPSEPPGVRAGKGRSREGPAQPGASGKSVGFAVRGFPTNSSLPPTVPLRLCLGAALATLSPLHAASQKLSALNPPTPLQNRQLLEATGSLEKFDPSIYR